MTATIQQTPEALAAARFRANPGLEVVLFDRLPEEYRKELAHVDEDPDAYGVLWPRAAGLTVKAIDRETALLFLTLAEPGPLPRYVHRSLGGDFSSTIVQLVLDDVLEIEIDDRFVSGATAFAHLTTPAAGASGGGGGRSPGEAVDATGSTEGVAATGAGAADAAGAAEGRVAELSRLALRYAARLEIDSGRQLALWLYQFNAVPRSARWRRRLADEDAVADWLGLAAGSPAVRRLARHWEEAPPSDDQRGWRFWSRRAGRAAAGSSPGPHTGAGAGAGYKLYVSPRPEQLPEALPRIVDGLAAGGARAFKIGRDLAGLLRPDKMVAYFDDFESLAAAADLVAREAGRPAAQGVPFTAVIDAEGLLSWGMDPPGRKRGGQEIESWRLWVVNRLAVALLAAKGSAGDPEPWRFALARLEMEGVNTATWAPRQTMWQTAES